MEQKVLAIGGSTYDITASILGTPVPCDSNPSRIYGGAGGVGRNIAENIARMGIKTSMITAFGKDAFSDALIASCENVGMDVSQAIRFPNESSGIYLSIMDKAGELQYAASDLTLIEKIPCSEFENRADYLRSFPFLLLEANLTEPMLRTIAAVCDAKIVCDAVSVTKAVRLRAILPRIEALKVNRMELAAVSGIEIKKAEDIDRAAEALMQAGVKRVYVTMGMEGSCCFTGQGREDCPAYPVKVVNVTGAGDAFTAAVMYGIIHEYSDDKILRIGTAASHIALQSEKAVSEQMSEDKLLQIYEQFSR